MLNKKWRRMKASDIPKLNFKKNIKQIHPQTKRTIFFFLKKLKEQLMIILLLSEILHQVWSSITLREIKQSYIDNTNSP